MVALEDVKQLAASAGEREQGDPDQYPEDTIQEFFSSGLMRVPFPQALGGNGWTALESTRSIELIAAAAPISRTYHRHAAGLAGVFGSSPDVAPSQYKHVWRSQIEALAGDYRVGRLYVACNSEAEAGAGGSLAATKTIAHLGNDGLWNLSGTKILASSGRYADVFISSAKVTQEDLPRGGAWSSSSMFRQPLRALPLRMTGTDSECAEQKARQSGMMTPQRWG